jgi:hypothetical protein
MNYLLDANVFIQAKNLHYGFDFCPAFWDWLVQKNEESRVFSLQSVESELFAGNDELKTWAEQRGAGFFLPPDQGMLSKLGEVSTWATSGSYEAAAVNTFLSGADYYLVAFALAHGHTVVTHEIAAASTRKIKIPNACIALRIRTMTPYEMLRREGALFVLGRR